MILFVNVCVFYSATLSNKDDRVVRLLMWLPAHRIGQRHQSQKPPQCGEAVDIVMLVCESLTEREKDVAVNAISLTPTVVGLHTT